MRALILAALLVATPALAQQARLDQPQSIWRPSPDGTVEHLQSGLQCPSRIGRFERGGAVTYEPFGFDVSCGYNGKDAVITLYLTRRPGLDVDMSFAGAKLAVTQNAALRDARLVSEGTGDQAGLRWRRAEFALGNGFRSDIWVADLHGWVLKYRASYQPSMAADVAAELAALTDQVQRSAGAHLATCAKSQPPERKGRPARARSDQGDALMGALLGGVAAAATQAKGAQATTLVWCVEGPVEKTKAPMLAWRGVMPDGSPAESDRVTAMTVGPPPTLESTADTLGALLMAETGRRSAQPRWVATYAQDGRTTIYGHYDGRPPVAPLGQLLQNILDGKANPLGSYSLDSGTVNIGIPTRK